MHMPRVLWRLIAAAALTVFAVWAACAWMPSKLWPAEGPEAKHESSRSEAVSETPSLTKGLDHAGEQSARTEVVEPEDEADAGYPMTLRFESSSGSPLPRPLDVLVESQFDVESTSLDSDGECSVHLPLPWTVTTRGRGLVPTRHRINAHSSAQLIVVTLDDQTVFLSGQCWTVSRIPAGEVELSYAPDSGKLFREDELSAEALRFLGIKNEAAQRLSFVSTEAGEFNLIGVGIEPLGRLYATGFTITRLGKEAERPSGYVGAGIAISAPETRADVVLHARTTLHGRVVYAETREPAEGVNVIATIHPTPDSVDYSSSTTDESGLFILDSPVANPHSVEISCAQAMEPIVLSSSNANFPDLGTIRIPVRRSFDVLVMDADKHPIPWATISVEGVVHAVDVRGLAHVGIERSPQEATLSVTARGFKPSVVRRTVSANRTETIVLRATNRLEILLFDESGRALPGYGIRCTIDEIGEAAASFPNLRTDVVRDTGMVTFWASSSGRMELGDLPSSRPLDLDIVDPFGCRVDGVQLAVMGADERREVQVHVDVHPMHFGGVVRDEKGDPIAGLTVVVESPTGSERGSTDIDGRFEVSEYNCSTVRLTAHGRGWIQARSEYVYTRDGAEFQLYVVRSVDLVVILSSSRGVVPGDLQVRCAALDAEGKWVGRRLTEDTWELSGVIPGMVEITATSGQHEAKVSVDSRSSPVVRIMLDTE